MVDRCIFSLVIFCISVICDKGEAAENENTLSTRKFFYFLLNYYYFTNNFVYKAGYHNALAPSSFFNDENKVKISCDYSFSYTYLIK